MEVTTKILTMALATFLYLIIGAALVNEYRTDNRRLYTYSLVWENGTEIDKAYTNAVSVCNWAQEIVRERHLCYNSDNLIRVRYKNAGGQQIVLGNLGPRYRRYCLSVDTPPCPS